MIVSFWLQQLVISSTCFLISVSHFVLILASFRSYSVLSYVLSTPNRPVYFGSPSQSHFFVYCWCYQFVYLHFVIIMLRSREGSLLWPMSESGLENVFILFHDMILLHGPSNVRTVSWTTYREGRPMDFILWLGTVCHFIQFIIFGDEKVVNYFHLTMLIVSSNDCRLSLIAILWLPFCKIK